MWQQLPTRDQRETQHDTRGSGQGEGDRPNLRSRATLRNSPKRHFVDPSLAAAGAVVVEGPKACGKTETARRRVASSVLLEADAIVQLADGRWAAFEIKLGAGLVEEGAASLRRFRDVIDTRKTGAPLALAVITGTGYGYRRPDGIDVIPIGALAP